MSEERPEHPQQPAEGGEEEVEAPGADRSGNHRKATEGGGDESKPSAHPDEPAEGAEEDVEAPGGDRAGDGG